MRRKKYLLGTVRKIVVCRQRFHRSREFPLWRRCFLFHEWIEVLVVSVAIRPCSCFRREKMVRAVFRFPHQRWDLVLGSDPARAQPRREMLLLVAGLQLAFLDRMNDLMRAANRWPRAPSPRG